MKEYQHSKKTILSVPTTTNWQPSYGVRSNYDTLITTVQVKNGLIVTADSDNLFTVPNSNRSVQINIQNLNSTDLTLLLSMRYPAGLSGFINDSKIIVPKYSSANITLNIIDKVNGNQTMQIVGRHFS